MDEGITRFGTCGPLRFLRDANVAAATFSALTESN